MRSIAVDLTCESRSPSQNRRPSVDAKEGEQPVVAHDAAAEVVPGTETGSATAVEDSVDKGAFVEVPKGDQEKADSGTATVNVNPTAAPSPLTAPPSAIRPGLERRDSTRPPTPASSSRIYFSLATRPLLPCRLCLWSLRCRTRRWPLRWMSLLRGLSIRPAMSAPPGHFLTRRFYAT